MWGPGPPGPGGPAGGGPGPGRDGRPGDQGHQSVGGVGLAGLVVVVPPGLVEEAVGHRSEGGQQPGPGLGGEQAVQSEGPLLVGPGPDPAGPVDGGGGFLGLSGRAPLLAGLQAPVFQLATGVVLGPGDQVVLLVGIDRGRTGNQRGLGPGELPGPQGLFHLGQGRQGLTQFQLVDGLAHPRPGLGGEPLGRRAVPGAPVGVGLGHPGDGQGLAGPAQALAPVEGRDQPG